MPLSRHALLLCPAAVTPAAFAMPEGRNREWRMADNNRSRETANMTPPLHITSNIDAAAAASMPCHATPSAASMRRRYAFRSVHAAVYAHAITRQPCYSPPLLPPLSPASLYDIISFIRHMSLMIIPRHAVVMPCLRFDADGCLYAAKRCRELR